MFKPIFAGALALGLATSAGAATFIYTPGGASSLLPGETIFTDFNAAQDGLVTGSGYQFKVPPADGSGAPPATSDGSRYLSVLGGGTATINFAPGGVTSFNIVVGSLDGYNDFDILFASGPAQTLNGDTINGFLPADGNQSGAGTNGFLRVTASAGETITGIRLRSSQNSFEVDKLGVRAVPEPATWGMMILGFGAIGAAMRRRTSIARVAA